MPDLIEIIQELKVKIENLSVTMSKLHTDVRVMCNNLERLENWKECHKKDHKEIDRERITKGQALLMVLFSTSLGVIAGIIATIISKGMF